MKTLKLLFEKQIHDYTGLFVLLAIIVYFTNWPGAHDSRFWGSDTSGVDPAQVSNNNYRII